MEGKTRREKICADPNCREQWEKMGEACRVEAVGFTYCPFCAAELNIHCSACQETLNDPSFRYCPWCGREFDK